MESYIYHYLLTTIKNPIGVCALMGNLKAESNLKSNNAQNSGNKKLGLTDEEYTSKVDSGEYTNFVKDCIGYGIAQWTQWSRKEKLLKRSRIEGVSIGDLTMQMDFMIDELKGYPAVWNSILTGTDIKTVSDIILTQYEKPANQSDAVKNLRASYSKTFYNEYFSNNDYYKIPNYSGYSIVEALYSINEDFSFAHRKRIAETNGIKGYTGKAEENLKMLNLLVNGKLRKVD